MTGALLAQQLASLEPWLWRHLKGGGVVTIPDHTIKLNVLQRLPVPALVFCQRVAALCVKVVRQRTMYYGEGSKLRAHRDGANSAWYRLCVSLMSDCRHQGLRHRCC
jgi:hypothetical protein